MRLPYSLHPRSVWLTLETRSPTPISIVSILPCNQQNPSVIAQRRLPLPICSDRVSSSKWLRGSVKSPRAPLTPPIGHLIKPSDASNRSNGAMLRPQPSAIYIRSPDKSPTPAKASGLSSGRNPAVVTENGFYSPPELLQTPSNSASNNTALDPSQSPPDSVNASHGENLTTDKKSKHKLTKQVIHKVVERERRRKCSEIITTTKNHFLPDLFLEVSSNSHKSVVPRNIVLEYSLAQIVCLQRKCDQLDRDYKTLLQKRERDWHAQGKEEDRSRFRSHRPMAQSQLDSHRDPSPGRDSRDTPPTSSPSSPATRRRKRVDPEISGNETESRTPSRYLPRTSDFLQLFAAAAPRGSPTSRARSGSLSRSGKKRIARPRGFRAGSGRGARAM